MKIYIYNCFWFFFHNQSVVLGVDTDTAMTFTRIPGVPMISAGQGDNVQLGYAAAVLLNNVYN